MAKKYIVDLNKDEKAELVALTQQETVSTERRTLIDKTRLTVSVNRKWVGRGQCLVAEKTRSQKNA